MGLNYKTCGGPLHNAPHLDRAKPICAAHLQLRGRRPRRTAPRPPHSTHTTTESGEAAEQSSEREASAEISSSSEQKRNPRWSPPARDASTGRWLAAGPSRSTSSPRPLPPSALPAPGLAPTGPALLPSGAAPPRATRRSRRRTPFSRPSLVRNLPCFLFFFFFLPHCPRIIRSTSY